LNRGAEPMALAALPFDLYQRHKLVQEAVEGIRNGRRPLSILDVGGAPGHLRAFLPHDRVVVTDREGLAPAVALLADACALPFADRSFDVVVSIDTLEHVPPPRRPGLLAELGRVTGDALLLAAPFHRPRVAEAEVILAGFLKSRLKLDHRFLDEHLLYGLPDREATARAMVEQVGPVVAVPNGCLDRWLLMMGLSLYLDVDPNLADLKRQVSALYNVRYYRRDNSEPAYRHLLAARRPPAPLLEASALMAPPGDEGRLDFSAMAVLIEMTGIDLLKDAYRSITALQQEIGSKDVHAANLEAERARWQGDARRLGDAAQNRERHAANLEMERERLQGEVQRLMGAEREGQRHAANLEMERERLQGEVQRLMGAEREGQRHAANLEMERERLQGEVQRLMGAEAERQRHAANLEMERERLQGEVQRLAALRQEGQALEVDLRAQRERLQNEVQCLLEVTRDGHKREADLQGERDHLRAEVQRLLALTRDLEARLSEQAGRLASLRDSRGVRVLRALGAVRDPE
jgi:SAM-dependent methyltransferase